ncbi:MAG: non-canonical purine NTP pyrophosphatase, partial [Pseudomonadota bacterium]
ARAAASAAGLPALSDDSGIEVEALGGRPGVRTADWAETPAGRDFPMAMEKVWRMLEEANAPEPRRARFVCTLCLAWPDGHEETFRGEAPGRLVWPMRGERGFGFDPIFVPEGREETFGEMDPAEKHRISHRADAFAKLVKGCFGG